MQSPSTAFVFAVASVLSIAWTTADAYAGNTRATAQLKLDRSAGDKGAAGPSFVASITPTRPAQVVKEPVYAGEPHYLRLQVGDGPNAEYVIAFDEPADAPFKVYVDLNRDGNLGKRNRGCCT